ncbi:MAG: ATP-binding cassette domain-containing protein [Anaerolineales bacterium]|nr:ATP-binding cassette domain-containing protein [Anaerolineales bacterium]
MPASQKLLSVRNLSRSFGPVEALSGVSFDLEPGEVLGVVGQRGSGKSTLFRLLGGAYAPSGGEILFEGRRFGSRAAWQARQWGIEAVYQNPPLANNLTVLQNIFLGRELCHFELLRWWPKEGEMAEIARAFLADFDMPPELLHESPANLSNEQRQLAAIAHALCRPCKLLLLDDTLAALSFQRQQKLLDRVRELAAQNVAVIISSDDLKHIFAVTNRILVLYQGRQAALRETQKTTAREVVEWIVGSNRQEQVTPVIWAFENYYAAQQQAEELQRAQQVLQQSLKEQDSLNRQLIERLRKQLQSLDRLNLALQEANRRLMTEREAERKALARELHDQVIQDLLSYTYQLEDLENEAGESERQEELAEIRNGIRQVVSGLRQICSDLRPPTIDSHGLSAAIRSLAHQWSKQTGIKVELDLDPELGRLPEPIELSVFRIVQEGLSNVRKHALGATRVALSLYRTPTASLVVRMSDDGPGIEAPIDLAELSEKKHFGLVGISERVSLLGGSMQIDSSPGGGVQVCVEIPSPYPTMVA